jgi:hypothetical protein
MLLEILRGSIGRIIVDDKELEFFNVLSDKTLQHHSDAVSAVERANDDRDRRPTLLRSF